MGTNQCTHRNRSVCYKGRQYLKWLVIHGSRVQGYQLVHSPYCLLDRLRLEETWAPVLELWAGKMAQIWGLWVAPWACFFSTD